MMKHWQLYTLTHAVHKWRRWVEKQKLLHGELNSDESSSYGLGTKNQGGDEETILLLDNRIEDDFEHVPELSKTDLENFIAAHPFLAIESIDSRENITQAQNNDNEEEAERGNLPSLFFPCFHSFSCFTSLNHDFVPYNHYFEQFPCH